MIDSTELFEDFVYGLAVARSEDRCIAALNRVARELLLAAQPAGSTELHCCELICERLEPVVGGGCMTEWVARSASQLPEVRMDIQTEAQRGAAWVTASPLGEDRSQVVFHLRPGRADDRRRRTAPGWSGQPGSGPRPDLQVSAFGRFQVEGAAGPIAGDWVGQRPGQLLKLLICERRRALTREQIGELLWPEAGPRESGSRLRYNVHALRDRLDPDRPSRAPARFVLARDGGYLLDTAAVWLDADRFEVAALAGIAAGARGMTAAAGGHLAEAMGLYRGEFLAGDPYLEWAAPERERLHQLACRALRAQVQVSLRLGELEPAAEQARRLAEMEPFDGDAQRLLIEVCLRQGRRSEAHRRFTQFAKKLQHEFGGDPGFKLSDVEATLYAGDSSRPLKPA